jgi:hypothetical protein
MHQEKSGSPEKCAAATGKKSVSCWRHKKWNLPENPYLMGGGHFGFKSLIKFRERGGG